MYLNKRGQEVLAKFRRRYGDYLGEQYFWDYVDKHPGKTKVWFGK